MPPRALVLLVALSACNPDLEPVVGDPDAPVPVTSLSWTFDADLQGWAVTDGSPAGTLNATLASWNGATGQPAPGSARLDLPFVGPGEQVMFGLAPTHLDLTGRVIRIGVQLDSGLTGDPTWPVGAQVYAFSSAYYVWANGPWVMLLTPGEWAVAELAIDAPDVAFDGFDGSDIHEFGLQIATGEATAVTPGTVLVDSVSIGP